MYREIIFVRSSRTLRYERQQSGMTSAVPCQEIGWKELMRNDDIVWNGS